VREFDPFAQQEAMVQIKMRRKISAEVWSQVDVTIATGIGLCKIDTKN